MYTYETFYDHYVILKDGEILYHIDTEAEAKKEIRMLEDDKDVGVQQNGCYSSNYICYHLHTEQSLLDSCTNYKVYVDKAKELGQQSICFTEHGNLYNWLEKKMYCEEQGIKYLHGIECYLTETLDEKIRDNYHTILIAKNFEGFKELNNLVYKSTTKDHTYYKPRLSFNEFLNISDNIIKISACLASPLNKLRDREDLLRHYDYYEIQYHNINEQTEYNHYLYQMSQKYNKPLIVGTDTHAIDKYKSECRTILQWGKTEGAWGDDENEFDLTYKSYDELVNMFKEQNSLPMDIVLQAIENTNIMADSCESLVIDTGVKYPILYGEEDEEVMWNTLRSKYKEKVDKGIIEKNPRYAEDIKEEMRVFKKTNMIGFMLFMSEMLTWCRESGIPTSPCRGSVGGSTVAYISDITDVDPVKWNTVFSRFCNEDREEVGDIDVDFYEDDRPKVYDYIINRFGKEKTAYILASGTVADKGAIDLIGRALDKIYKKRGQDSPYTLAYVKQIKAEYESNPQSTRENYKELFYYFDGILNTVVSQSQHPAGLVASPINLIDNYSMFEGKDGQLILPINMEEVHECGLVKYDILGLKNVGVIRKVCEYINKPYPLAHEIDWNNQNVYKDIITSPVGIFQFEGSYAFKLLKDFKAKTINDLSLVNASLRPSGESYRDKLIAHVPNKNPSELIDKLLEPNHGYLVFQEDAIAFLQQICGLSGSEADNVRRAIGRKQMDRLQRALPQIFEGYCNMSDKPRDIAEKEAKEFLQIIEDASSYMFGYNHSTGYSMLGYLCGYMRYYHPKEFVCAYLNCAENDKDIYNGTMLAKQKGVKIVAPKFRRSLNEFMPDPNTNTVYKGLASIKDIGKNNGSELYTLKDNQYPTFFALLSDIKAQTNVNSKQLDILIKLDFFKEFGDINTLLYQVDIYTKFSSAIVLTKSKLTPFELSCAMECCGKETEKQLRELDNSKLLSMLMQTDIPQATVLDKIKYQIQLLGYTDIIVPTYGDNLYAIENLEINQWGTVFLSLYHICDGESFTVKVDKAYYKKHPCTIGDVLKCSFREQHKRVKVDNEWVESEEIERILKVYSVQ